MVNTAIVINTCPKYFYLLDAMIGLLRRYAAKLDWPIYLATEEYANGTIIECVLKHKIQLLKLDSRESDFFSSRAAAMRLLPESIQYVLPLQDDFLLERPGVDLSAFEDAVCILDMYPEVQSLRLMPCPGARGRETLEGTKWIHLKPENGDMMFCYQATIWRRQVYLDFMKEMLNYTRQQLPEFGPGSKEWSRFAVDSNPAELHIGNDALARVCPPNSVHVCWLRHAAWANAVYWCPFPYRPTAVVKGVFQPWAKELLQREGFRVPQ